jgi:hypothetical protein
MRFAAPSLLVTTGALLRHANEMNKLFLKLLMFLFISWFLASCGYRAESFDFGRGEKICPPKEYLPRDVWFLPEDKAGTSDGFSFMGCGFITQKEGRACTLPSELINANVEAPEARRSISWRELKGSADYRTLINTPGVHYSLDVTTGFYVLSNKHVQKSWSIWMRGDVPSNNGSPRIDDADILVATCYDLKDYPGGPGRLAAKGGVACNRYARGKDYSLNYEFVSREPVPSAIELRALDSKLFRQVYAWRCRK